LPHLFSWGFLPERLCENLEILKQKFRVSQKTLKSLLAGWVVGCPKPAVKYAMNSAVETAVESAVKYAVETAVKTAVKTVVKTAVNTS